MTSTWRQLLATSIDCNSHLKHSSYVQLATVRAGGVPANRTVLFRGFVEGTDKLQITTDIRTKKIEEIQHCPCGEICWYFTESWEQFRIQGDLDIIDEANEDPSKSLLREKAWFSSSLKSRSQFVGPRPGITLSADDDDGDKSVDLSRGPVGTFVLLTLEPQQVDYLNLKTNSRLFFKRVGCISSNSFQWTSQEDLEKVSALGIL